ncbi:hypothetical protein [Nostoc sp.]
MSYPSGSKLRAASRREVRATRLRSCLFIVKQAIAGLKFVSVMSGDKPGV